MDRDGFDCQVTFSLEKKEGDPDVFSVTKYGPEPEDCSTIHLNPDEAGKLYDWLEMHFGGPSFGAQGD